MRACIMHCGPEAKNKRSWVRPGRLFPEPIIPSAAAPSAARELTSWPVWLILQVTTVPDEAEVGFKVPRATVVHMASTATRPQHMSQVSAFPCYSSPVFASIAHASDARAGQSGPQAGFGAKTWDWMGEREGFWLDLRYVQLIAWASRRWLRFAAAYDIEWENEYLLFFVIIGGEYVCQCWFNGEIKEGKKRFVKLDFHWIIY